MESVLIDTAVILDFFFDRNNGIIQIILTRNIKDFHNSNIAIITPEMYIKNKASQY